MNMIDCEITPPLAILTLNRPDRRNALSRPMIRELSQRLDTLSGDEQVAVIILTGEGGVFCAGSDLKVLAGLDVDGIVEHEAETAAVVRSLQSFPKPIIAAVEGYALGGGLSLAAACDLVVAAEGARLAMPEVANGWIPPWGLNAFKKRCSLTHARRLVWGAESFSTAQLLSMGVIDHLAEPGQAISKAKSLAQALALLPPGAVSQTKRFFAIPSDSAEADDTLASGMFREDCRSDAAKASFQKFSKPKP